MSFISVIKCFEPRTTSSYAGIIPEAICRAMRFDAIIVTPDNEEAVLAIGDSVGGVSESGFMHDLMMSMAAASQAVLDNNQTPVGSYMPDWLETDVYMAVSEFVGQWLDDTAPWADYDGTSVSKVPEMVLADDMFW